MKELYKALAQFQQEVPHIYKGTEGYGYSYADWGQILDIVNPLLKESGLGFTQLLNGTTLTTRLFHSESDTFIESSVDIPQDVQLAKMNTFQVMGSAITYYRRYSLSAILGLVTDADKDASGDQVKPKETKEIRNRTEEAKEAKDEILSSAKADIKTELENQGFKTSEEMQGYIKSVIGKTTIDSIDDAHVIAEALDNQKEA
jgi:hypothetical protein